MNFELKEIKNITICDKDGNIVDVIDGKDITSGEIIFENENKCTANDIAEDMEKNGISKYYKR